MKRLCVMVAPALAAVAIFCGQAHAVNDLIALWNFQTNTPADVTDNVNGPIVVAESGSQIGVASMTGVHTDATSDWTTPVGNGSSESYSANGWSVGAYLQFTVNTTGFADLGINFTSASSGTGPKDFKIQYSTDGTNFTDAGVTYTNPVTTGTVAWSSNTNFYHPGFDKWVDLRAISAIDNKPAVTIRLVTDSTVSAAGGTLVAGGTARIDNVSILGSYSPRVYGDFNENNVVDAADYIVWKKGVAPLPNEVPETAPGTTDAFDYGKWKEAFGNTVLVAPGGPGSGLGASAGVPEPTSLVMFLIGVVSLGMRRRAS